MKLDKYNCVSNKNKENLTSIKRPGRLLNFFYEAAFNKGGVYSKLYGSRGKSSSPICPCCKQDHLLLKCDKYKEKKLTARNLVLSKATAYAFNCLSNSHSVRECS